MNRRKLIGGVAFALLLIGALAIRYIGGIIHEQWAPLWSAIYGVGVCVAFFMTFYDRKNLPEKYWDFNPKRGLLYFLLGWIIFPFMMVVDAVFGADITLGGMAAITLCMSVLIGIAGMFTEHVGV